MCWDRSRQDSIFELFGDFYENKKKTVFLTHSKDFRHIYIGCTKSDCNSEKNQNDWTCFTRSPCRES